MTTDPTEFDLDAVVQFIYDPKNQGRIIWSPSTTLAAMGIERYPHQPPTRYRRMKKVLAEIHENGILIRRNELHSHYTMKEVAYQRVGEDYSGVRG